MVGWIDMGFGIHTATWHEAERILEMFDKEIDNIVISNGGKACDIADVECNLITRIPYGKEMPRVEIECQFQTKERASQIMEIISKAINNM